MPLTIEHHAVMFALLAKHAIEISGEKGKEAILAGMTRYGNERGRRMALNALERGDKLTVLNSQAYGVELVSPAAAHPYLVAVAVPHFAVWSGARILCPRRVRSRALPGSSGRGARPLR